EPYDPEVPDRAGGDPTQPGKAVRRRRPVGNVGALEAPSCALTRGGNRIPGKAWLRPAGRLEAGGPGHPVQGRPEDRDPSNPPAFGPAADAGRPENDDPRERVAGRTITLN